MQPADAAEVAGNINRLWGEKQIPAGEKPPQAEANRTLNVLVVKGTQEQIDEIVTDYYIEQGWDEQTGVPTAATLEELGIEREVVPV